MPEKAGISMFMGFLMLWVALGTASCAFFVFSRNAALKRKVWPAVSVGAGTLFLAFVGSTVNNPVVLYFMVPAVIGITFLNLIAAKFCDSCGRTHVNRMPFSPPEYCSGCGARFER